MATTRVLDQLFLNAQLPVRVAHRDRVPRMEKTDRFGLSSTNNGHEQFNGTLGELLEGGPTKTDPMPVRASLLHYNFICPHREPGGITPAGPVPPLTQIQYAAPAAV